MIANQITTAVYDSFDALPSECLDLFKADHDGGVFSTLPWFRNLVSTVLARSGRLRIHVIRAADGALLVVPMWQPASTSPFGGRNLQGAANFYTSLFAPLSSVVGAQADDLVSAWARAVAAERPRWDRVTLSPLSTASPLFVKAADALAAAGYVTQRYFCFGNWYLSVGGRTYAEYFAGLPSKLRHTVTRKSRALATLPGFRMAILMKPEQAREATRAFDHVYAGSWKSPEPFPDFIPGLIRMCAAQGWLRMGVAYLNETPIAFQIWIVHRRVASVYKLAYDAQHARLSVGSVLTAAMMEQVLDHDQISEVDYLTGDEVYKQDWMSGRRERWGIVGFSPRSMRGAWGAARSLVGRRLKSRKANRTEAS